MARTVKEWVGADDNSKIPDRVRQRVVARSNQCCANCGMRVRYGGEIDHKLAIINGGKNAESNLRLLCRSCHTKKTGKDVAEKSAIYQKRRKLGPLKRQQSKLARDYAWAKRIKAERAEKETI